MQTQVLISILIVYYSDCNEILFLEGVLLSKEEAKHFNFNHVITHSRSVTTLTTAHSFLVL